MNFEKEQESVKGYCAVVGDLLRHEKVREMHQYPHHRDVDTLYHSVCVSYLTYKICEKMHWHPKEATRAALLHDFYLYNWYTDKHDEWHAVLHPKMACKNAEHYFGALTPRQEDMILCHMWPLHLAPPHSREGFVLTFADKVCAVRDLIGTSKSFAPVYERIFSEVDHGTSADNL